MCDFPGLVCVTCVIAWGLLVSAVANLKFEQGSSHFYFAVGPANPDCLNTQVGHSDGEQTDRKVRF